MDGYVAVTHGDWFAHLAQRVFWDEVNFWRPSAYHRFLGKPGSPFFFKFHAPANAIGGFGLVASFSRERAEGDRFGAPRLVRPRLGQGTFRVAVTDAYGRACAVTNEHSLPVLEAAHIRPYTKEGPHELANGLLVRSDLHRLFDAGYITVTAEHRLEVSPRLRADYDNGRSYYPLHGSELKLPSAKKDWPGQAFLRWHNENVYQG